MLVASQDFVEGVLVKTILPKNNPPTIVHDKVLTLIQVSAGGRGRDGRTVPPPLLLSRLFSWVRLAPLPTGPLRGARGEPCWLRALLWSGLSR